MRRVIISVLAFLLVPSLALAAGTYTAAEYYFQGQVGKNLRIVEITVTCDGSAGEPADTALKDILTSSGKHLDDYGDWWLFKIEYEYGSTGFTDDSDLYLYSKTTGVNDVLGGNGVDALDETAYHIIYPATSTQPLTGDEILSVANNDVNSATCVLRIFLYK